MTSAEEQVVKKYLERFENMPNKGDNESIHGEADDILLEALQELGFGVLSDAWYKAGKDCGGFWYA
jgi:hypothetical protein